MKTLSHLASLILPMLSVPASLTTVHVCFADGATLGATEAALDELILSRLVGCDEHEGVPFFYRRDVVAEKARMAKWSEAQRAADKARDAAILAANQAYIVAMDAADAERDAADPMAAIKGQVAA